jgi:hypothetical protein
MVRSCGQSGELFELAGHVGLELRNVVAKYPFESSHGFPEIQPNSGHRDYSRVSCERATCRGYVDAERPTAWLGM